MIVKLQIPLAGTEAHPPALVYDRARSFRDFVPMAQIPAELLQQLGGAPKGYFEAHRSDDGHWLWIKRVEDQPW